MRSRGVQQTVALPAAVLGALLVFVVSDVVRAVELTEVVATALFLLVAVGTIAGLWGGLITGIVATVIYALLRHGAVELGGSDAANRLIATRGLAYVVFGVLGGWLVHVLRPRDPSAATVRAGTDSEELARQQLASALRREIASATRHDRPLSVVRFGDDASDPPGLERFAAMLRASDVAARTAADDVITILLPDADEVGAQVVIERLREVTDATATVLSLDRDRAALETLSSVPT